MDIASKLTVDKWRIFSTISGSQPIAKLKNEVVRYSFSQQKSII